MTGNAAPRVRGGPCRRRTGPDRSPHGRTDLREEGSNTGSGSAARATSRSSTAAARLSASRPTASSPSSAGRPTTSARSSRASTSCAPSPRRAVPDAALRAAWRRHPAAIDGWPKVERVLRHIDAVEALGIDPADVRRSLAARPQPAERRPGAARLHAGTPCRVAQAPEDRAMSRRLSSR
jgi:hypothetical protein